MSSEHTISVLVFVPGDFEITYLRKILIPLSQDNRLRIYVINRPADLIIDMLRGYKRLRKRLRNRIIENGKIKILNPFVFFNEVIHGSLCSYGNINMRMLISEVKRLIRNESIKADKLVLLCSSAFHWEVLKEIEAKKKIYYVDDEYCYDPKDRFLKRAYQAEKQMILFSDEVICASEKLKEKFEKEIPREKIHLISTPADNRSFQECKLKEYWPWDIIPSPKLVIFGVIRYQTDLALIEKLALKVPAVSIVFIGKNQNKKLKTLLKKYQNVYHLGYLSYEKANYCLRSAAIGLYPARKCKYSTYANPNRIYEYAAAGIPVVTTNVSRESDFPESIKVVESDIEFLISVQRILAKGISVQDNNELIGFAKKHSANEIAKAYIRIFQSTNSR